MYNTPPAIDRLDHDGHNEPILETHHLKWFSSQTDLQKVIIGNEMQASLPGFLEPLRTSF